MAAGLMGRIAACAAWFALATCSVLAAQSAKADQPVVREYRAEVTLDVDVHGQVAAIQLPADVPAVLAGPAREAIGHWRFEPPMHEGRPVTARTWARVTLQLVPQAGGNYGLRVVHGSNGPKLTFTRSPEYPRNEIRQRGQGKLVMEAIVRPDGTLTDVHVASYRFNHPDAGAFRKSAEAVMQQAHAQPELVDGKPVATRIQVPFVFALQGISLSEALSRQAGEKADDTDAGPIGDVIALDSPVQPVAGPRAELAHR